MALIIGGVTVTGTQTLDATKLTGNLPEISGADLTNLPAPSASAVGTAMSQMGGQDVGGVFAGLNTGTSSSNTPGTITSQILFAGSAPHAGGYNTGATPSGTSMSLYRIAASNFGIFRRVS
jgi:hypothetical protein|tara:strand:- start:1571 stop:1933 length:363 start_codon:yes stop_codon:yes gene_type:complete